MICSNARREVIRTGRLPFPIPFPRMVTSLNDVRDWWYPRKEFGVHVCQFVRGATVVLRYDKGLLSGAWLSNQTAIQRDFVDDEITDKLETLCTNIDGGPGESWSGWVYGKVGKLSFSVEKIREILVGDAAEEPDLRFVAHGIVPDDKDVSNRSAEEEFSDLSVFRTRVKDRKLNSQLSMAKIQSAVFDYVHGDTGVFDSEQENDEFWPEVVGVVFMFADRRDGQVVYSFEKLESKVVNVTWHTNGKGHVYPVAAIETIVVDGRTYSSARFEFPEDVVGLALSRGSIISLEKNGERLIVKKPVKPSSESWVPLPYVNPDLCPSCNSKLNGFQCNNKACVSRLRCDIERYCKALGIPIGRIEINDMVRDKMVLDVSGLYYLTEQEMARLFGDRAIEVYKKIMAIGEVSMVDFLTALGISSRATAEKVSKKFTFSDLLSGDADFREVLSEKASENFLEKFNDSLGIIGRLLKCVDVKKG